MAASELSLDNDVFRVYLGYAMLLALKLLGMSFMISTSRVNKSVFANTEDSMSFGNDPHKFVRLDPAIERMRRVHMNDIENYLPFLIVGLLYVLTGPSLFVATWHFRVFVISRLCHTVAYLTPLPQPSRFLLMYTGVSCTASMIVQCIMVAHF